MEALIKKVVKVAIVVGLSLILSSYDYNKDKKIISENIKKDSLDLKGVYFWNFKLLGMTQESINTFYADSIVYEMKGLVYSTRYTIQKVSYNNLEKKWIGKDGKNIFYVMYFKDKTDSTVIIYKHKCKKGGMEEAVGFPRPKSDTRADHGWNLYRQKN